MSKKYNYIYSKLVEGEGDFVGHIAYSLYKQDKIAYIEDFKNKNGNNDPTDVQLEAFHQLTTMPNYIATYRMKAENILDAFMNTTLSETVKEIEQEVRENQEHILAEIIQPIKPHGFFKSVALGTLEHFFATLIFSGIVAAIIVASFSKSVGAKGTIENIFDVKISPDTTHIVAPH